MTISASTNKFRYQGNGVTDTFAFTGRIFSASDLVVEIITRATDALVETLTITTHYTVTINGDESATIVVDAAKIPSSLQDIQIRRALARTQTLNLPTGTVFPAVSVENALDKNMAVVQDLSEKIDRAVLVPTTSTATPPTIGELTANEVVFFDGTSFETNGVNATTLLNAGANATAAAASAAAALASENKAEAWAEEDYDVEVETGRYSAKHWATEAQLIVNADNQWLKLSSFEYIADHSDRIKALYDTAGSNNRVNILLDTSDDSELTVTSAKLDSYAGDGYLTGGNDWVIKFATKVNLEAGGAALSHMFATSGKKRVKFIDPYINANAVPTNGIAFANSSTSESGRYGEIYVENARFENFKKNDTPTINANGVPSFIGSGSGIDFEWGGENIVVNGLYCNDCYIGLGSAGGTLTGVVQDTPIKGMVVNGYVAKNVDIPVWNVARVTTLATDNNGYFGNQFVLDGFSFTDVGKVRQAVYSFVWIGTAGNADPFNSLNENGSATYNGQWRCIDYDAGLPAWDPMATYNDGDEIKYVPAATQGGIFNSTSSYGAMICNGTISNTTAYGGIGAIFMGTPRNFKAFNINAAVDCEYIFDTDFPRDLYPVFKPLNFMEARHINIHEVNNWGITKLVARIYHPFSTRRLQEFYMDVGIRETGNLGLVDSNITSNADDYRSLINVRNLTRRGNIRHTAGNLLNTGAAITDVGSTSGVGFKEIREPFNVRTHQSNNQIRMQKTGTGAGIADLWIDGTTFNIAGGATALNVNSVNIASVGTGQTWQDLTASRSLGTTYTNSTGRPIYVAITQRGNSGAFVINSITVSPSASNSSTIPSWFSAVIPNGATYSLTGGNTPDMWAELR